MKNMFARGSFGRTESYGYQYPRQSWFTSKWPLNDWVISAHIQKKLWIATSAPWVPSYGAVDMDHPGNIEQVQKVMADIGFEEGQYLLYSSPSYDDDGSIHAYFKPIHDGQPVSLKTFSTTLEPVIKRLGQELFPRRNAKFRLPFGRKQYLLDPDTGAKMNYTLGENLAWFDKMDDFDLSTIMPSVHFKRLSNENKKIEIPVMASVKEILRNGLQAKGTRHEVTKKMAKYFYFRSMNPEAAKAEMWDFFQNRHNGNSTTINRGRWREVSYDINSMVDWVWSKFPKYGYWPTHNHNRQGWVTRPDILFITDIFKGNLTMQKRFFKLISIFRSRLNGKIEFLDLPWRTWRYIAGDNYPKFQAALERMKALDMNGSYWATSNGTGYCKSFRLNIKPTSQDSMIQQGGRATQDYHRALLSVYKKVKEATQAAGIPRRAFYENKSV